MQTIRHLVLILLEIRSLIESKLFILLTVLGNGVIGISGLIFYYLEFGKNPMVKDLLDAIWWSFSTATTTGYGNIVPVTVAGKILSIFLMLMGLAIFSMFTALFAEAILSSKKGFNKL